METAAITALKSFHAHLYFSEGDETAVAHAVVDQAAREIGHLVKIGRFHNTPVGPHPRGSIQLHIEHADALTVFDWLMRNRQALTVFFHGNSGDSYVDHTQHVAWLGESETLNLEIFQRS